MGISGLIAIGVTAVIGERQTMTQITQMMRTVLLSKTTDPTLSASFAAYARRASIHKKEEIKNPDHC